MLLLRALFGDKVRSGITGHGGLNGTSLLSQSEQMVSAHFLGHANVHFFEGFLGFEHHPTKPNYSNNRFSNLSDTPFLTAQLLLGQPLYWYLRSVLITWESKQFQGHLCQSLWRDESERTSQESRTHHKTSSSGILLAKPRHLLLSLFQNKSDR